MYVSLKMKIQRELYSIRFHSHFKKMLEKFRRLYPIQRSIALNIFGPSLAFCMCVGCAQLAAFPPYIYAGLR